jgi:hypothetical protein
MVCFLNVVMSGLPAHGNRELSNPKLMSRAATAPAEERVGERRAHLAGARDWHGAPSARLVAQQCLGRRSVAVARDLNRISRRPVMRRNLWV